MKLSEKGIYETNKWIEKNINFFGIDRNILKIKPICELAFCLMAIDSEIPNNKVTKFIVDELVNFDLENLLISNSKNVNLAILLNDFIFIVTGEKRLNDEVIDGITRNNWNEFTEIEKKEFLCYRKLIERNFKDFKFEDKKLHYRTLTVSQEYSLTHYIFFKTYLGRKKLDLINQNMSENLNFILSLTLKEIILANYDIASELILSFFMISNINYIQYNSELVLQILNLIYDQFIGGICFKINQNNFINNYHTILVNNMLWREVRKWEKYIRKLN